MRKILYSILLMVFTIIPVNVFAEGYISVSPSTLTIEEGSSKTISITAFNAIGDVTIKSNGTDVATVNSGFWETGQVGDHETKKGTITVRGIKAGSTTITFTIDAATFDGEDLAGQVKTVNVNVVEKKEDTRSKNNKLESLTISGYELEKVNDNNYKLTVGNSVSKIKIEALAEDEKAKVNGAGEHQLKVGENKIEVVVTAENGSKNKITINITRRDGYYIEDLGTLIKDTFVKEADIIIRENENISKENIRKIKDSKKIFRFNYYNNEKEMIYSWILDGNLIDKEIELVTNITNKTDNEEKISKLTNYSEGIYVNFKHSGNLPKGTKVKVYVGEKYESNNLVNIYHYDGNKLNIIKEEIIVSEGYIEFDIKHCSEYFVTRSNLHDVEVTGTNVGMNKFMIISIVELLIIVILLMVIVLKKNNKVLVKGRLPLESLFMTTEDIFPINNIIKNQ